MTRYLLTIALFIPALAYAAPAPAKSMAVCINLATGAVTSRPKCKAPEAPLTASVLANLVATVAKQGPAGPQGAKGETGPKGDQGMPGVVNTASCYVKRDEYQLSTLGRSTSVVFCNDEDKEFMLGDGMEHQPDVELLVNDRSALLGGLGAAMPTGVVISTRARLTTAEQYQLRAYIVCCKR